MSSIQAYLMILAKTQNFSYSSYGLYDFVSWSVILLP